MKVSSLLYENVLLEGGSMSIQAGPHGATSWRHGDRHDRPVAWQTPKGRKVGQDAPISLAIARETRRGVPSPGPYHQVVHSETSICWLPTLEPFVQELPSSCDWIVLGYPSEMASEFKKVEDRWKRRDDANGALARLVPEQFVRSRLVDSVSHDLAVGASGGWDVSVDRFHGRVIGARFAGDATIQTRGFALPILVPRVGDLDWADIFARWKANRSMSHALAETSRPRCIGHTRAKLPMPPAGCIAFGQPRQWASPRLAPELGTQRVVWPFSVQWWVRG